MAACFEIQFGMFGLTKMQVNVGSSNQPCFYFVLSFFSQSHMFQFRVHLCEQPTTSAEMYSP